MFAIIAVIDKGKILPKYKQYTMQFIQFYRIVMLEVIMSHLNKTFYKL